VVAWLSGGGMAKRWWHGNAVVAWLCCGGMAKLRQQQSCSEN